MARAAPYSFSRAKSELALRRFFDDPPEVLVPAAAPTAAEPAWAPPRERANFLPVGRVTIVATVVAVVIVIIMIIIIIIIIVAVIPSSLATAASRQRCGPLLIRTRGA